MPRGNSVGPKNLGVVEKHLKFNFTVTENVGVGCATGAVLSEKVLEDIVPVVSGKIGRVQSNTELVANLLGIRQIGLGGAVFSLVVFIPVLKVLRNISIGKIRWAK